MTTTTSAALIRKARTSATRRRAARLGLSIGLQLKAASLPTPETEVYFARPVRLWRFDFAWAAPRIALEVEGGIWSGGRHTRGRGYEDDCEKYNHAAILGWLVIRASTAMVDDGRAIDALRAAFSARDGA